jgi:Mrp family chromosome partitioning ATPase
VLDSPPVLAIVDAVVLSRYADGIVLVIDARRGRRQNVRRAVATLRAVDAPILGFVFNKTEVSSGDYGYYGTYPARERDGAEVP